MQIISGVIHSAQKVVVYGPEGIGKSTFASQFPDALFIDTEGSTKKLNVRRFEKPSSWEMLKSQVEYVRSTKPCKTLIIDTIDWAEQLCIDCVCAAHGKKGIEDFGYGNGYYPIHRVDGSEVLKDLSAGADMPTWNKTWKQNFRQKKTSEDRKKEAKESLETAFSAVAMDGGKAKISEVSEYLGVTEKTVRNRLKNDKDFWVDDGWCGLK